MSKIIYFTTAQSIEDFEKNLPLWSVCPNTSNQNFHNKLIRALATGNDIEVISVRPINKNFKYRKLPKEVKKENNINWNYIKVKANRIDKLLFLEKRINALKIKVEPSDVVVSDVLSLTLLKAAKKFAKKHNIKIIGVCTDDPRNISFSSKTFAERSIKLANELDGYLCLTTKLAELFNINNKKQIIIDGVTEENKSRGIEKKPYIFFGGSLMHKYGVYNLIKAFDNLKIKDVELYICGHHKEENFDAFINSIENVKFLGSLSYRELIEVESHALLSVNPRPIDERIDEYSIPSKTLESLANGVLTVCVNNELLKKNYEPAIIWSETGEVEDLQEAIQKALNLNDKEKADMISAGKKLVRLRTSFESVATLFKELL